MKTVNVKETRINQYEMVLGMTQFIRANPDAVLVKQLKECTQQATQMEIFSRYLVEVETEKNKLIPKEMAQQFKVVDCPD